MTVLQLAPALQNRDDRPYGEALAAVSRAEKGARRERSTAADNAFLAAVASL
ncbi:hypothetical protein AB0D86_48925 [Streptomyces sp. NPDC048324]|uniref:hypothetical protein n=1 Tax=Streptomyces sp. NPDC048324 TaxID=3157205 RepID=UPI0034193C87